MFQHRRRRLRAPRSAWTWLAALALAGGTACAQPGPGASGPGCVADGEPQAGLPQDRLTIHTAAGPVPLRLQIAADDATRQKGLMFVRRMGPDEGMIFDFHAPRPIAFWMHNTYIPLDLLFVRADGRILSIARNARPCNDAEIPSGGPVRTVIELNAGAADRLGVREGDRVTSQVIYPGP